MPGCMTKVRPLPWTRSISFGAFAIEFPMQPKNEVPASRLGQGAVHCLAIDLGLNAEMGSRFDLEIVAFPLLLIELAGQARSIS